MPPPAPPTPPVVLLVVVLELLELLELLVMLVPLAPPDPVVCKVPLEPAAVEPGVVCEFPHPIAKHHVQVAVISRACPRLWMRIYLLYNRWLGGKHEPPTPNSFDIDAMRAVQNAPKRSTARISESPPREKCVWVEHAGTDVSACWHAAGYGVFGCPNASLSFCSPLWSWAAF
jgi:hypothetical protein